MPTSPRSIGAHGRWESPARGRSVVERRALPAGRFVETHNLYVRGQFMYQSNYVSGLRILDISNSPGFAGSWSNYPFFESGVIVFTSMREGLFVVRRGRQPVL